MITFRNILLCRGTKQLFKTDDLVFYPKQKIGIVGKNGSGKTSLLELVLGRLSPDEGQIELSKRWQIAHVEQEIHDLDRTSIDFTIDGDQELRQLEKQLKKAEETRDGTKIAEIYHQLEAIDGYTIQARAATILHGLGFSEERTHKKVQELSGGWRMRVNLARALICRSDILLLDEPTNHLDLDAVIWLERWLIRYPGMLLLISHDREFLDHVATHIAHIENQTITFYAGNYSSFEQQRTTTLALQQKSFEKQQKERAHIQKFIDRFKAKATKASQAQCRIKMLERMQEIAPAHVDASFSFHFFETTDKPNILFKMEGINFGYEPEKPLLKNIYLQVEPEQRIGLLGPNGAGKSTLIKLMAGKIQPSSGSCYRYEKLKIGYFAQHALEELNPTLSPLEHMQRLDPKISELTHRNFLGSFDFCGDMALSPIEHFSGGEKARLALALIVWQKPNLLLLDEPTNHLDLDMCQALDMALEEYSGAMILVSHDRYLLKSLVDDLYMVHDHHIEKFEGDVDDYQQWLIQSRFTEKAQNATDGEGKVSRKEQRKSEAEERQKQQPLRNQIRAIEKELEKHQNKLRSIDIEWSDPKLYEEQNKERLKILSMERNQLTKQIDDLEEKWLRLNESN